MNAKPRGPSKDGQPPVPQAAPRQLLLDSIRNKIRQGYYTSEGVTEDVSDKLARLFEP